MAFPSTASSTASLEEALKQVTSYAGLVKQRTQGILTASNAGPVDGAAIVNYLRDLVVAKTKLNERASVPGLAAYAQTQYNDPTLNITTEYNNMLTAINNTIVWISTNFPKDANGYLLYEQIGGDGTVAYRSFTTAQLATFRTQLTALIATIA